MMQTHASYPTTEFYMKIYFFVSLTLFLWILTSLFMYTTKPNDDGLVWPEYFLVDRKITAINPKIIMNNDNDYSSLRLTINYPHTSAVLWIELYTHWFIDNANPSGKGQVYDSTNHVVCVCVSVCVVYKD